MKVYIAILTEGEEWSGRVLGVFSTKKAAQAECDKHSYGFCYVEERIVD